MSIGECILLALALLGLLVFSSCRIFREDKLQKELRDVRYSVEYYLNGIVEELKLRNYFIIDGEELKK